MLKNLFAVYTFTTLRQKMVRRREVRQ